MTVPPLGGGGGGSRCSNSSRRLVPATTSAQIEHDPRRTAGQRVHFPDVVEDRLPLVHHRLGLFAEVRAVGKLVHRLFDGDVAVPTGLRQRSTTQEGTPHTRWRQETRSKAAKPDVRNSSTLASKRPEAGLLWGHLMQPMASQTARNGPAGIPHGADLNTLGRGQAAAPFCCVTTGMVLCLSPRLAPPVPN